MSNDRKSKSRPRRVTTSHPVEVEISDLTFDDVTKPARSATSETRSTSVTSTTNHDTSTPDGDGASLVGAQPLGETSAYQFDFENDRLIDSTSRETVDHTHASQEDVSPARAHDADDSDFESVPNGDGDAEIQMQSWRAGSLFGWACFKGLAWGVIWILLFLLISLIMDKTGIIDAVNSLMGAAMHFDLSKMMELSVVAGIVLGVFVALMNFFDMLFLNAYSSLVGSLKAKASIVWKKPVGTKTNVNGKKSK